MLTNLRLRLARWLVPTGWSVYRTRVYRKKHRETIKRADAVYRRAKPAPEETSHTYGEPL